MLRKIYNGDNDQIDINLSPLIDMMFLLLIFFVVTTSFVDQGAINIQKPQAYTTDKMRDNNIVLNLTKDEQIFYVDKKISILDLRSFMLRILKIENKDVIINVDQKVPSGLLVQVMDECRLGGAQSINIATEKIKQNE